MRDAAGERADGVHLLRLRERLAVGEVAVRGQRGRTSVERHRAGRHPPRLRHPVGTPPVHHPLSDFAGIQLRRERLADHRLRGDAGERGRGGVRVEHAARRDVDDEERIGGAIEDVPVSTLPVVDRAHGLVERRAKHFPLRRRHVAAHLVQRARLAHPLHLARHRAHRHDQQATAGAPDEGERDGAANQRQQQAADHQLVELAELAPLERGLDRPDRRTEEVRKRLPEDERVPVRHRFGNGGGWRRRVESQGEIRGEVAAEGVQVRPVHGHPSTRYPCDGTPAPRWSGAPPTSQTPSPMRR